MVGCDVAVYLDGKIMPGERTMQEALDLAEQGEGFCWVSVREPGEKALSEVARVFRLHPLSVAELEDMGQEKQRPKLEKYAERTVMVLRPARYLDDSEIVEFGELHVFVDPHFIVTVQHGDCPDLGEVRTRLETEAGLLHLGPLAGLYAILDRVVDDYQPVLVGLENDIVEIEEELFRDQGVDKDLAKRIYLLSREVIEFQRATKPLLSAAQDRHVRSEAEGMERELRRYMRSVEDHLVPLVDRLDSSLQLLRDTLTVHMGLVNQERNDQMAEMTEQSIVQSDQAKKISSWAAIIFAPSLISGIYGMNFVSMGELNWSWGYPLALVAMIGFAGALFWIFKKRDWL